MIISAMIERHPSEPEKLHITPERKKIYILTDAP